MATRQSAAAYDFLRWMAGWAITRDVGGGWLIAYKMAGVQGREPEEDVLFYRQEPRLWHAFHRSRRSGAGTTPHAALSGKFENHGLYGPKDRELKAFCKAILGAPRSLASRFAGLDVIQCDLSKAVAAVPKR